MLFNNKPRFLINQDLLFRCHRLYVENDIAYTMKEFQWECGQLYEVEFDTASACFYIDNQTYDSSVKIIYQTDNKIFHQGDKLVCIEEHFYHSINGLAFSYLDFNMISYQIDYLSKAEPDSLFAEVVKLNELEYFDYLYGRD